MRVRACVIAAALAAFAPGPATAGATLPVEALDDLFAPEVLRVEPGSTVGWTNEGRNQHTVTAEDGSFDSGNLVPGATFARTFADEAAIPYFCVYHGDRGGVGMAGVILVGDAALPVARPGVGPGLEEPPPGPGRTIRVPTDEPTIQAGVDAASPGDMVLVEPGTYREAVKVLTPYITIRGVDRNTTVLDGGFADANGVQVIEADGVAIENVTARHYLLNGLYWTGVNGYRASYVTAYNNGDYGVYAFDSRYGVFEHSYASGHPDSGFYIGQCRPCDATIVDVIAERNGLGYSGTNASGNVAILNSVWTDNMAGIVPNTLDSEELPPQGDILIAGNDVHDNNNRDAPAKQAQFPAFGTGILIAGGRANVVRDNLVVDHASYGIAVLPNLDERLWFTERNLITGNVVRRSGRADLVLAAPSSGSDRFVGNDARTTLPPGLQEIARTPLRRMGGGDLGTTIASLGRYLQARGGDYPHGDWRVQPPPPPQFSMAGAADAVARHARLEQWQERPQASVPVERDDGREVQPEVTMLGIPFGTTWWSLLLGVYGYVLPLVLYTAWVVIALWDVLRRDLNAGGRAAWMAVILLVPVLGPVAYYVVGGSEIPASVRWLLVAGALVVYAAVAALGVVFGAS